MRNSEASREKILGAALAEFAAHGIAGARVDRIAAAAGCSKNLIYIYFTDKETLFTTVLRTHLLAVYEDIVFTAGNLAGYAGQVFDYAMAHPELMRLMAWFALEQRADGPAERAATVREKLLALQQQQMKGHVSSAFPPGFLLTLVMTLATAWTAANAFGLTLDPQSAADPVALRRHVTDAIGLLVDPGGRKPS